MWLMQQASSYSLPLSLFSACTCDFDIDMVSDFVDLVYIPDFSSKLVILNARLQFEQSFWY